MRLHSLFARRPSPAFVMASVALFLSLGGVGYAAFRVPNNSVGGRAILPLAVGFRKIQFNAVGIRRINPNQVQARVNGICGAGSSIASIDIHGNTQCTPTAPKEFGASGSVAVGATATSIASLTLPAGSTYLVYANPQVSIGKTTANAQVAVDCTLSLSPGDSSTTQTRSVTFQPDTASAQRATVSLMLPAPVAGNGSSASVACTTSTSGATPAPPAPTVTAATAINAVQTASNS